MSEKLENDLLSMGTTESKLNGDGAHASSEDLLGGLDLTKKLAVSISRTAKIPKRGVHSISPSYQYIPHGPDISHILLP